MKRLIAALCALLLLAGCSSTSSVPAAPLQPRLAISSSQPSSSEAEAKEVCPLDIEDISLSISIQPYHKDTNEIKANYENSSPLTVTYVIIDFLDKSNNEKGVLSSSETVLNNETSPNFDSFVKAASVDDIQLLKARFIAIDSNGIKWRVNYDYKLNTYDWFEAKE